MSRAAWWVAPLALAASVSAQAPSSSSSDPTPGSVEDFRAAAERVLAETGVPGAGLALVRQNDVEWEGGVGFADRDARTPVTADTHFRVGSVSKTFVAMALVQLSEDLVIDLDSTLEEVAPEIAIDNPWHDTDPVRVIHVLQHTAGFDDMHFNETYNFDDEPNIPLDQVLRRNPRSRRVRWQPGTRMSYSNPGYAVAGYILEKLAKEPYEEYIKREIFVPLEMHTSSFRLVPGDEHVLAKGYDGPSGPPVGYPQIYLRPAGNLHSSPREMARFVRMLLNWGELGEAFVIDPEYLGNMEQPRTTLAARSGLRDGYGSGIFATLTLPYRVLGHNGGISGFLSSYGYSPSRDVGFVVLLNSTGARAGDALNRLSALALRYMKHEVDPPSKLEVIVPVEELRRHEGFYLDANPRNQFFWPMQFLLSGWTVAVAGEHLYADPVIGERRRLIPVTDRLFRLENELAASRVFTTDTAGTAVLAGSQFYAERRPRWRVELIRVPVLATIPLLLSPLLVAIVWVARIKLAQPRGFWNLKLTLLACPMLLALPVLTLALTPTSAWGARSGNTIALFLSTLALPVLAIAIAALAVRAGLHGASRWLVGYAVIVALALASLCVYLGAHGLLGVRLWQY